MTALAPLERAAPLLRCPGCRTAGLALRGDSLECAACGKRLPIGGGCLDLVGRDPERASLGQRFFLTRPGARGYALVRESRAAWLLNRKTFAEEVAWLTRSLDLSGDEIVLDAPCGQGNFTQAIARAVPRGIVIGLDLSQQMLEIARERLEREALHNVVLVRGDALELPLRDAAVEAVSSCGGLHLYPDVPRAISEMRRVLAIGRPVAGLTFLAPSSRVGRAVERLGARLSGARAFAFDALGREFARNGFDDFRWQGEKLIGWFSARAA